MSAFDIELLQSMMEVGNQESTSNSFLPNNSQNDQNNLTSLNPIREIQQSHAERIRNDELLNEDLRQNLPQYIKDLAYTQRGLLHEQFTLSIQMKQLESDIEMLMAQKNRLADQYQDNQRILDQHIKVFCELKENYTAVLLDVTTPSHVTTVNNEDTDEVKQEEVWTIQ